MKKIVVCLSFLFGGMLVVPLAATIQASEVSVMSQDGTEVRVTGFKRTSGGVTVTNRSKAIIRETNDGLKAWIRGNGPYTVTQSDREGYSYMFYADGYTWYY